MINTYSDVEFEWVPDTSGTKLSLVLTSDTQFDTYKTYLALKVIVEGIEAELGILDGSDDSH